MRTGLSVVLLLACGCGGAAASNLLEGDGGPSGKDGGSKPDVGAQDVTPTPDVSPMHDVTVMDVMPIMDTMPPPKDIGPPDTGPKLPPVMCGSSSCAIPAELCCYNKEEGTATCESASEASSCEASEGTAISCEDGADCPGEYCCGTLNTDDSRYLHVECSTTCSGTAPQIILCDPKATPGVCGTVGLSCGTSTFLPGYYVCQ
jgi:hypothetical protein